ANLTITNLSLPDNTATIDNVRIFRAAPTIVNGGFESPDIPAAPGHQENNPATGWTGTGTPPPGAAGPGIVNNGSGYVGPNAVEGSQAGLLKGTSDMSQIVSGFNVGSQYSLTYSYVSRQGRGEVAPLQVSIGGNVIDNVVVNAAVPNYQTRT